MRCHFCNRDFLENDKIITIARPRPLKSFHGSCYVWYCLDMKCLLECCDVWE